MSSISENIVALRKKNNLTQEELGTKLGVSAQSISKWENCVSMPDICLLPMIADTLGASIDELFGITKSSKITKNSEFPRQVHKQIFENIASWLDLENASEEYEKYMSDESDKKLAATFTPNGAVFQDKSIAVVFPETAEKAQLLIGDKYASEFLAAISNQNVQKTLAYLARTKQFATVASIANKCKTSEIDTRNALKKLKKYLLVNNQIISLDDETVEVWRIYRTHSLLFIFAIMHLAKRASITEDNYFCYHGDELWCY